jgi:hypothetical protein
MNNGEELLSEGGGYSPVTPINSSAMEQPEQEDFPADDMVEENEEKGNKELAPHEVPIPHDGSEELLFGDDVTLEPSTSGVWEINFHRSVLCTP